MYLVMVNSETDASTAKLYIFCTKIWLEFVFGHAYMILQWPNIQIVILHVMSFDWFVGLVFWGGMRVKLPWTHFQLILNQNHVVFCVAFCFCRMTK